MHLFINSATHPFPPDLHNIINHKRLELGSWNFERMFTPPNVSCVTCHVSRVTYHVSRVTCPVSHVTCHVFFWTKWWSLSVEGLLSTGPTPSTFHTNNQLHGETDERDFAKGRRWKPYMKYIEKTCFRLFLRIYWTNKVHLAILA